MSWFKRNNKGSNDMPPKESREEMLLDEAIKAGEIARAALKYQREVHEELKQALADYPLVKDKDGEG